MITSVPNHSLYLVYYISLYFTNFTIIALYYRKVSCNRGILNIRIPLTISLDASYNFVNSKTMIGLGEFDNHSLLVRSSPRAYSILLSFLRTCTRRTCKNPKQAVFDRLWNVFRSANNETVARLWGKPFDQRTHFSPSLVVSSLTSPFYRPHDRVFNRDTCFWPLFRGSYRIRRFY